MDILELIQKAGVENVKVQPLQRAFKEMIQHKHDAEITFFTDKAMASELAKASVLGTQTSHVGLVLWVPASALPDNKV